jgi:tetratricopeptide (TPR) repeat protein
MDANDAHDLYAQGRSVMESGDIEAALERFRQSIRIFPHFKTLELLGECLLLKNQHSEAIVYLAAAAGLGLKQSRSRFLLAKAHLAVGEKVMLLIS